MAVSLDTDYLIEALKRRINVPTVQGLYSDSDFARIFTDELHNRVVPFYMKQREDYFLTSEDFPLDNTVSYVAIPKRAIGQKFSDINFVESYSENPARETEMKMSTPGENSYLGYYIKGNRIYLSRLKTSGYLRVYYYRRPATLALTGDCPTIQSIVSNAMTLDAVPTDWAIGDMVDIVSQNDPYETLEDDMVITNISGVDVTFASIPSTVSAGNRVCPSQEAPFAQIPNDASSYLVAAAAVRVLQGTNYQSAYQVATKELELIESNMAAMITPRADRDPRRFTRRAFSVMPRWGGRAGL